MAKGFIGEDPCENESQRQRQDDEHGFRQPVGSAAQGDDPHVVSGAIQIQSRNHDDDGRHGDGDAGSIRSGLWRGKPEVRPSRRLQRLRDGGQDARSTSSSRRVLAMAPMMPARVASLYGLLNMIENPKTPQKLASQTKQEHPLRIVHRSKGKRIRSGFRPSSMRHDPRPPCCSDCDDDQRVRRDVPVPERISSFARSIAACDERKSWE